MSKIGVVVNGNEGIGLEITKRLCNEFEGKIYATARNWVKGEKASQELRSRETCAEFRDLDMGDEASLAGFRAFLETEHRGVDVLLISPGSACQKDANNTFYQETECQTQANFLGPSKVLSSLVPLLRPHARVVLVSDAPAMAAGEFSPEIETAVACAPSEEALHLWISEYLTAVKSATYLEKGWPRSCFGVISAAVEALTGLYQRSFEEDSRADLVVNATHPGPRGDGVPPQGLPPEAASPAQAATVAVSLALLPPNVQSPRGQTLWFEHRAVVEG